MAPISWSELARTATGRSELAPAKGDRRFADPAWDGNWLHFPWCNPTVIKETVNTGGANLLAGARQLTRQVFTISWRNPEQAQGHFDFDTYAQAVAEARDAVAAITAYGQVHLAAACSGGMITAGLLGNLAAAGDLGAVASPTLMVCALDNDTEGTVSALASRDVAAAPVAESARKGYVDGQALAGVFTWLRPNDLVWSYVVSNYLLGKAPPAFDILYWNQDTVRLAAGLHRDFIRLGLDNSSRDRARSRSSASPSTSVRSTSTPTSSRDSTTTSFPWQSAYRGARLFAGSRRFVLSSSGHIQALVNPPPREGSESRASYLTEELLPNPEEFLARAPKLPGSWWTDWDAWLRERSGALKPAPKKLGDRTYKAHAKAPGSYVLAD